MINNISWSEYWTTVGIIAFIYYAAIAIIYYSQEMKHVLSGDLIFARASKINTGSKNEKFFDEDAFALVSQMKHEITTILKQAHENNSAKQEVLFVLQLITKKFPTIKEAAFESEINHYIQSECLNYCSIHLNEEEMSSLWVK